MSTGTSGIKVTQVYPEKSNLAKYLPAYLSSWTTDKIREQNIDVIGDADVTEATLTPNKKQVSLKLSNGKEVRFNFKIKIYFDEFWFKKWKF